ncbi:MAG: hypothetical protein ABI723_24760 [Bacteroidia bacterium]
MAYVILHSERKLDGGSCCVTSRAAAQRPWKTCDSGEACDKQHKQIDISRLAAGVYTVKIYNNSMAKAAKLIISR